MTTTLSTRPNSPRLGDILLVAPFTNGAPNSAADDAPHALDAKHAPRPASAPGIRRLDHLFDAITALGTAEPAAGPPCRAVILAEGACPGAIAGAIGAIDRAVAALRMVDPSVPLIGLGLPACAALDAQLPRDATAEEIRRTIDGLSGAGAMPSTAAGGQSPPDAPTPPPDGSLSVSATKESPSLRLDRDQTSSPSDGRVTTLADADSSLRHESPHIKDRPTDEASAEAPDPVGHASAPAPAPAPNPAPATTPIPSASAAPPSAPETSPAEDDQDEPTDLAAILGPSAQMLDLLLAGRRDHADRAINLLRRLTRCPGLSLDDPADDHPGTGTIVEDRGRIFGVLRDHTRPDHPIPHLWAFWLALQMGLADRLMTWRDMAYHDDLTGAWNRRSMRAFLDHTLAAARKGRRPVTVMLLDIDDLKHFNDDFGHQAGDLVLRETAALLTSVVRAGDRVCRIGGDEFLVIMADVDEPRDAQSDHASLPAESMEAIAERFYEQIRTAPICGLGDGAPGSVTISAGLATYPWDALHPNDLLRIADDRLRASKNNGKGRMTCGAVD